jgi:hypothetical protein
MTDDRNTLGDLADRSTLGDPTAERDQRRQVKDEYARLYAAATHLFFTVDPMGINFESNSDEYEPEVGTVLPRLESAESVDDVVRILREEFHRWFGDVFDGQSTDRLAPELWSLWQEWKAGPG